MSSLHSRRTRALGFVAPLLLAVAPAFASEPTGPLTAEPTVPRPSTKPCVVTVFSGAELIAFDSMPFTLPAGCPGPWSKIVLEADMASTVRTNSVANLRISMYDNADNSRWILYMGAPQIHDGVASWRVERDLTDYAAMFRSLTEPAVELEHDWDNDSPSFDEDQANGDVRLLFYPASGAQPAPRVPDGVFAQGVEKTLPRNIVKAYVEVLAQGLDTNEIDGSDDRAWYTCMPDASIATYPALRNHFAFGDNWGANLTSTPLGCNGGSFREVEVWLDDNQFLGVAPIYPWLPSNFHRNFRNTVDKPVPSAHGLNFIPYRVDVSPFASKLNDGVPHTLSVKVVGDTNAVPVHVQAEGKLFVFLDKRRHVVPGAVVINTLQHASPSVTPLLTAAADVLTGTVRTADSRKMDVVGYVDTSAGRIYNAVHTELYFDNQQTVRVDGLTFPFYRSYAQLLALDNRAVQGSVRMRGATVLERDVTSVQFPLRLGWGMSGIITDPIGEGFVAFPIRATGVVDQTRLQYTDQWRGATHYATALRDHFTGRHTRDYGFGAGDTESDWSSQRDYVFLDTLAGCYTAVRLTTMGALSGSATGIGCPRSVNFNRWFTRPDGSPENMGWAP